MVPFIQGKGIVIQCWYPLGGRGYTADLLGNETIRAIAKAHGVSAAQVILRWDLQRSIVAIPGSFNPEHMVFFTRRSSLPVSIISIHFLDYILSDTNFPCKENPPSCST